MQPRLIDQQVHGYRSGHQLIASTIRLMGHDQDLIDRLSDIGGQLRPGETFRPYLTAYPLPSGQNFVVARTWQDLDAPRSGCVKTRSLILPIDEWLSLDGISSLLPLLTPVSFDEKLSRLAPAESGSSIRSVSDPRRVELVEALFLEPRQPIVIFDSTSAEIIVERLFLAFWPALKRNFSVSTYALAPRKIEGKPFDLMFAPKAARARFSDWRGRRIEGSSSSARHPWSFKISERIFETEHPDLNVIDSLGALRIDQKGDESLLRLSLLWSDLAAKSRDKPSAVLGMLDILNSRSWPAVDRIELRNSVQRAMRIAVENQTVADALRFLSTLEAKISNFDARMLDGIDLSEHVRGLTRRSPKEAVSYLLSEVEAGRDLATSIIGGLADGLCESHLSKESSALFLNAPHYLFSAMILNSECFGREVWRLCIEAPSIWVPPTSTAILSMTLPERASLLHKIPSWMASDQLSPIIEAVLQGVSREDLMWFVIAIGRETGFGIVSLNSLMVNAAKLLNSVDELRALVFENFSTEEADAFVLSTLDLSVAVVAWLDSQSDRSRSLGLLRELLDRSSQNILASMQRDLSVRDRVIQMLMENVPRSKYQLLRFANMVDLPTDRYLDIGQSVFPFLDFSDQKRLLAELLERAVMQGSLEDSRVSALTEQCLDFVAPRQLINLMTDRKVSTQRVAANLAILNDSSSAVSIAACAVIEYLSERLVHRYGENLGEGGYKAWASLLNKSGFRFPEEHLRASLISLPFALGKRNLPVSSIICASFPSVYSELLKSTGDDDFNRLPALLALPISFFTDWDRAKSARHELVDTYIYSAWPPADLLLTSLAAGIQEKTVRRLSKTYRGREYLAAIDKDSHRLEPDQFSKVQQCLHRLDYRY